VGLTENIPFFREQHGLIGHILGGWAFSASYVYGSGQPYTPRQGAVLTAINSNILPNGNYFDTSYSGAFVGDPARPFYGNKNAAPGTVGIYCGDLAPTFVGTTNTIATNNAITAFCAPLGGLTQLLSLNALNAPNSTSPRGCIRGGGTCPFVPVTTSAVQFIINMRTAQSVFGTPFGNVPRNVLADAPSNRLDASIFKNIKIGERNNFEMRLSAINALNHFNYSSIDSSMEDAGLSTIQSNFGLGFANPAQTTANGRLVTISGRFTF
jgi:hypothetical protein